MKPKGTLIAIGGKEEMQFASDERFLPEFGEGKILNILVQQAGGAKARIEVITTASSIPEEVGSRYEEAFSNHHSSNMSILHVRTRSDTRDTEVLQRIERADAVMFSGGDQNRLSRVFVNTPAHDLIRKRYLKEKFVVAGTSAGAMIMSEEMIAGGKQGPSLRKGGLKMTSGLGLMEKVIFDTHFIQRGRFGRLAEAVALHPHKLGMGLGEDTGMIIKEGNVCEVIGSGMVIVFDGTDFTYNRCETLKHNMPISLGGLTVHVLAPGDKYHLSERRIEVYHNPKFYQTKDEIQ